MQALHGATNGVSAIKQDTTVVAERHKKKRRGGIKKPTILDTGNCRKSYVLLKAMDIVSSEFLYRK